MKNITTEQLETKIWWRIYRVITIAILWIFWLYLLLIVIDEWNIIGWLGIIYSLIAVIISRLILNFMTQITLYIIYGKDKKIN